jgi:hypothetical protein
MGTTQHMANLSCPGRKTANAGFFGRVLSIKIDAGSWIFDGMTQECPQLELQPRRGRRYRVT